MMGNLHLASSIEDRIRILFDMIRSCEGCLKECHVDRYHSNKTYCRTGLQPRLYKNEIVADSYFFSKGDLARIYFRHCNLRCVFCYDYSIHHEYNQNSDESITTDEYADILMTIAGNSDIKGIHLINVDHIIPQTLYAISNMKKKYNTLPIIFESNGFALSSTLAYLRGLISIYYTDIKFLTPDYARKYLKEEGYSEVVKNSIIEMYAQVGKCIVKDSYIQKGLVIKLLILPGFTDEYKQILDFLSTISNRIGIVILANYTPGGKVITQNRFPELNQLPSQKEIETIIEYAYQLGFDWVQVFC